MNDIIQLLPDSVANQIAAGEVIQRPASVIKELVENSIDAGATLINVVCVDSGRTSIQVTDNGKGMSETDARLSFERHATSKIRQADDLFNLHTMGFRGEALASIAAVAQVELRTRRPDDDLGTALTIAGSRFVSQEPVQCPVGCNFTISNLFYNVPVRRKFLKSNTTELNNIVTAFERIALVYPDVAFTLYNNQTELYNLKAGGLRQRIVDVIGKKINQHLLPIDIDTTMCKISGFVGKPESARKKGARQFFFVNGRYMKHPYFHKAIMTAYERLVPEGEQIPYFIYFTVKPTDIDVNIHPTKTEIKFENEQTIWQILMASVKESLGKFNDVPSIDFDTEGKPDIPVFQQQGGDFGFSAPKVDFNPSYNPFNSNPRQPATPENWEDLYEGAEGYSHRSTDQLPMGGDEQMMGGFDSSRLFSDDEMGMAGHTAADGESGLMSSALNGGGVVEEKSPAHYQYKGRYIMTAVKSGLMIIDQHRAHMRVLYDEYRRQMTEKSGNSQKLLFPEMIQLSPSDAIILQKILPDMTSLGFELSDLGGGSYAVGGIPTGLEGLNGVALVNDIVALAAENTISVDEEINHTVALGVARDAAIPYGQVLGNREMENLVNELFASSDVNHSPDGKTIIAILSQTEIDHLF